MLNGCIDLLFDIMNFFDKFNITAIAGSAIGNDNELHVLRNTDNK